MSTPSWPGSKPDATTKLAEAARKPRPSIGPPDAATRCDRCRRPLGDGVYLLQRSQMGGTPATWFICHLCNDELSDWWVWNPAETR